MRIILHVDMDSFFASVEMRERPELKDKAVVIGADPKDGKGRGVVATCSYEARKFGIRSAMPISKAYKLCPTAIFLPPDFRLYSETSHRIMNILRSHASKSEQVSVDEAYLDVSDRVNGWEDARKLALRIKEEVLRRERLTCSVGIAPNKTIAKIASDFRKPDGLTMVRPEEAKVFLDPLGVRKLPGIGPKTEEYLKGMGIETIGQLARIPLQEMEKRFGKGGVWLHELANGHDDSEVYQEEGVKSISRNVTFEEDTRDWDAIRRVFDEMADEMAKETEAWGYWFKTVSIKVRYENFDTFTRDKSLPTHTGRADVIKRIAHELFEEFKEDKRKIRLIGLRIAGFKELGKTQKAMTEFLN